MDRDRDPFAEENAENLETQLAAEAVSDAPVPSLDFQDFKKSIEGPQHVENAVESVEDDDIAEENTDKDGLLSGNLSVESNARWWSTSFFRRLFDIDTSEVVHRLLWALWPLRIPGSKPFIPEGGTHGFDVYGPFWISTTLVFFMAVTGNLASYIAWRATVSLDETGHGMWSYDFNQLTLAAILVFGYVFIIPFMVWIVLRQFGTLSFKLLEALCIWGYSLAPFIPASILCVFNVNILRWIIVVAAGSLSTIFLVCVWPIKERVKRIANIAIQYMQMSQHHIEPAKRVPAMLMVVGLVTAMTLALKYFFAY